MCTGKTELAKQVARYLHKENRKVNVTVEMYLTRYKYLTVDYSFVQYTEYAVVHCVEKKISNLCFLTQH